MHQLCLSARTQNGNECGENEKKRWTRTHEHIWAALIELIMILSVRSIRIHLHFRWTLRTACMFSGEYDYTSRRILRMDNKRYERSAGKSLTAYIGDAASADGAIFKCVNVWCDRGPEQKFFNLNNSLQFEHYKSVSINTLQSRKSFTCLSSPVSCTSQIAMIIYWTTLLIGPV